MSNFLNEIILGNWGDIRLNANIDEELKDVDLAILYEDHGDDFLLVRTKDNTYEYGWWLNRKGQSEYDDLYNGKYDWQQQFIRRPELFYKFDTNCKFSNEIFWEFEHEIEKDYYRNRNLNDTASIAQRKFNSLIKYMKNVERAGITYDACNRKRDLIYYLKTHDILTEENSAKLEEVKWDSRINGADGIAGKKLYEDDYIYGDSIKFIYHKGKKVNLKKVKKTVDCDSWGFDTFTLSLKQFK